MSKAEKGRTAAQLWNALERAELLLDQERRKNKVLVEQVSRLSSTIITIRNLVVPRGERAFSEDLVKEARDGQTDN